MSLNFNKNLFDIFGASSGFKSATTTRATDSSTQARQIQLKLKSKSQTTQMQLVNAQKLEDCDEALENHITGTDSLNGHINTRLDTFLDDFSVAAAVREIDNYIEDIPQSCANINTIAGTLTGLADDIINNAADLLTELDTGITDYEQSDITRQQFETLLDKVITNLNSYTNQLTGMILNELKNIEDMYKRHRQMAKAFSIQSLINDECVKPLIKKLAAPELSNVLINELGVEDFL